MKYVYFIIKYLHGIETVIIFVAYYLSRYY